MVCLIAIYGKMTRDKCIQKHKVIYGGREIMVTVMNNIIIKII